MTDVEHYMKQRDAAREALKDLFKMMDEGLLVRDISQDHSPDWATRSMSFVMRIKKAAEGLTAFDQESTNKGEK